MRHLEKELARLAALNRTEENLNHLDGIIGEEDEVDRSRIEELARIDFAFNRALALSTGSSSRRSGTRMS